MSAVRIREYCIHILVTKQPVILPSENDPSTSAESGCVTSARLDSPHDADLYVVGARITVVVFVIRPDKFGESTLRRHNMYYTRSVAVKFCRRWFEAFNRDGGLVEVSLSFTRERNTQVAAVDT